MASAKKRGTLFKTGGNGVNVSLDMFFDRDGIADKMDKKEKKAVSSTGAFTRKAMQRGMRRRKKASAAGDYPSAKPGNALLREKIRFGFLDDASKVIVGPALLQGKDKEVASSGKTLPELINAGGDVVRHKVFDRKRQRIHPMRKTQSARQWHYRPRPFVALTAPIAAKKLAENMAKIELK